MIEVLREGMTPYALWRFEITAHAATFDGLKLEAKYALERVIAAENWRKVQYSGSGGSIGRPPSGYSVSLKVPEETKIAALRKEADEREARLLAGGAAE